MMDAVPLSNQMTEAQFDEERARLRERGETSIERTAFVSLLGEHPAVVGVDVGALAAWVRGCWRLQNRETE